MTTPVKRLHIKVTRTESLVGDSLFSELESLRYDDNSRDGQEDADNENDNGNCSDASEREVKFDPSALKTEVSEHPIAADEDLLSDHFLVPGGGPIAATNETEDPGNGRPSKKKPQQKRRSRKLESDDDEEDKTWSAYSPKSKKKSVPVKKTRRGRKKYLDSEEEDEDDEQGSRPLPARKTQRNRSGGSRKKISEMTPEEQEEARAKWREERRKAREAQRATGISRSRRKPVSEMTEEERERNREKWREERRRQRGSQRANSSDNSQDGDGQAEVKSDPDGPSARRRKRVSEMTEEEREEKKAKWRDQMRLKRQRDRESMTEEERQAHLAKQREQKKRSREASLAKLSPEELQERRRYEAQRKTMYGLHRRSMMTDEEREQEKLRTYLRDMARLSQLTSEELEERKMRKREYGRLKLSQMTEEEREVERERRKEVRKRYWENMSPEKKAKLYGKIQEHNKKRMERIKQDPEQYSKWLENHQKRKKELNDLWDKFKTGVITEDELSQLQIKMRMGRGAKPEVINETPEERLKRFEKARRTYKRKSSARQKVRIDRRGRTVSEIRAMTETPAQREIRLARHRVGQAKSRTLRRLKATGARPEEIERKLIEIEEIFKAKPAKPYKPRMKIRKVKPDETVTGFEPFTSSLLDGNTEAGECTKPKPAKPCKPRKGRPPKSPLIPMKSEEPSVVNKQFTDNSPGPSQPSQPQLPLQQQYPYQFPYPIGGSSQFQVPFMQTINPFNQLPPNQANFYPSTPASSSSSSQLVSNTSHCNYADQQVSQDYCSSESFDPVGSPGHSYTDAPSPQYQEEDFSQDIRNDTVYVPPMPKLKPAIPIRRPASASSGGSHRNVVSGYFQMGRLRGPQRNRPNAQPRDQICEDCGNYYSRQTIRGHKILYHNPNFKDGRCLICGEEFAVIREWYYKHYRVLHLPTEPEKRKRRKRIPIGELNEFHPEKRSFLCNQCGKGYATLWGLNSHEKFAHGDFSKEENFCKCEFCGEKFKRKQGLDMHLRKEHGSKIYRCERCGTYTESHAKLLEHLKNDHENSYFPCDYCGAVQVSAVSKKFHTNHCKKVPHAELLELRKKWHEEGEPAISSAFIGCEFCPGKVAVHSLGRHYNVVHGLIPEEEHKCDRCGKSFKRREHFVHHLYIRHDIPMKECLDIARPYNVQNREGVVVQNPEGKPQRKKRRARAKKEKPVTEEGDELKKRRTRTKKEKPVADEGDELKPKKRRGRPPKAKKEEELFDSDSAGGNDEDDQDAEEKLQKDEGSEVKAETSTKPRGRKPKAKTTNSPSSSQPSRASRKSAVKAQKRIKRSQRDSSTDSDTADTGTDADEGLDNRSVEGDIQDIDISDLVKQEVEEPFDTDFIY